MSAEPYWTPGDDYAEHVLTVAWLRGAAALLFWWEQAYPAGHFGSASLGLIAAHLLDHAWCVEHHSKFPGPDDLHECPPSEWVR